MSILLNSCVCIYQPFVSSLESYHLKEIVIFNVVVGAHSVYSAPFVAPKTGFLDSVDISWVVLFFLYWRWLQLIYIA